MEKLVIYDLNLQLCDDYLIQKELNNMIVLSSDDEEELVVDDDEDDTLQDYAVSQDNSQNHDPLKYAPLSKTNAVPNLTKRDLRPRENIKSSSYLDLKPDTPTDSESDEDQNSIENSGKSFEDFCNKLSNGNDSYEISKINTAKLQEEVLEEIDVGTYDFLQENLPSSTVRSDSFETLNKPSRIYPLLPPSTFRPQKPKSNSYISQDCNKNLKECLRRRKLNELFTNLKHMIPSLEREESSKKEILESATFLCRRLEYECNVWKKLKNEQMKIKKQLGEKLKTIIAETIF